MKQKQILATSFIGLALATIIMTGWIPTDKKVETKKTPLLTSKNVAKKKPNFDYNRGYNQGYSMGSSGYTSLFQTRYGQALNGDQFDYADGMLDGYNAGTSGGSPTSGGGGLVSFDPTTGCKYVINDVNLANYLNNLGFGCYINLN